MPISRYSGIFNANQYNFGGPIIPPLILDSAIAAAVTGTVALNQSQVTTSDGVPFFPLNINAPVFVGTGTNTETVTPTTVTNGIRGQYDSGSFAAAFANAHGIGDYVSSATFGLQEAINACSAFGGGIVIIDASWTIAGGSSSILAAAIILPGVTIQDNRSGAQGQIQSVAVAIANAAVKTLFSVGSTLLPAPGAGKAWDVLDMFVQNNFLTTAFAAGGAIQASYGAGVTNPATANIAATFLTSPAASQDIRVAGALGSTLRSAVVNQPITLAAATADFTTGAGSLIVILTYRLLTGL
jgi:hypothetical protein